MLVQLWAVVVVGSGLHHVLVFGGRRRRLSRPKGPCPSFVFRQFLKETGSDFGERGEREMHNEIGDERWEEAAKETEKRRMFSVVPPVPVPGTHVPHPPVRPRVVCSCRKDGDDFLLGENFYCFSSSFNLWRRRVVERAGLWSKMKGRGGSKKEQGPWPRHPLKRKSPCTLNKSFPNA